MRLIEKITIISTIWGVFKQLKEVLTPDQLAEVRSAVLILLGVLDKITDAIPGEMDDKPIDWLIEKMSSVAPEEPVE